MLLFEEGDTVLAPTLLQTGAVGQHSLMAGYGSLLNTETAVIESHPYLTHMGRMRLNGHRI